MANVLSLNGDGGDYSPRFLRVFSLGEGVDVSISAAWKTWRRIRWHNDQRYEKLCRFYAYSLSSAEVMPTSRKFMEKEKMQREGQGVEVSSRTSRTSRTDR